MKYTTCILSLADEETLIILSSESKVTTSDFDLWFERDARLIKTNQHAVGLCLEQIASFHTDDAVRTRAKPTAPFGPL